MKERLNVGVSFYENVKAIQKPITRNLLELLTSREYAGQVSKIRQEKDAAKQKKLKQNMPAFTPSGIFNAGGDNSIVSHSGLICIDIDRANNEDVVNFGDLKQLIKVIPYVAYCGLSVRGEGYFCLIPIKSTDKHRQHFRSLEMDFKRCGIVIDPCGINVGRKRFVSDDEKPYINQDAETYTMIVEKEFKRNQPSPGHVRLKETDEYFDKMIAVIEKEKVDITYDYEKWFAIACVLANYFGEEGRERYHKVSQFHPNYSPGQTDAKFEDALRVRYNYNIGTFEYFIREHGLMSKVDFSVHI